MNAQQLRALLQEVRAGNLSLAGAEERLAAWPYADLGTVKLDHHRSLRCGMAEVVFGANKSNDDLLHIFEHMLAQSGVVLGTRLSASQQELLAERYPQAQVNALARTVRLGDPAEKLKITPVAVVTAGTSDVPVAEEARETLAAAGCPSESLYDVGVAGLHRLLDRLEHLRTAPALIVVAGMEGALPSVIGGLVRTPVVAVPTSIGYGASFGGVAALLGMLNTCAAGVTVVNIDNGFGAASAVLRILNAGAREPAAPAVQQRLHTAGNGSRAAGRRILKQGRKTR